MSEEDETTTYVWVLLASLEGKMGKIRGRVGRAGGKDQNQQTTRRGGG